MATQYPGQVKCIFLRNTSSTDSGDKFPYNTKGFKDLNTNSYMFFKVPEDLAGLDIVNGQCLNTSVPQNVTFGYQGLPFGVNLGDGQSNNGSSSSSSSAGSKTLEAANSWLATTAMLMAFITLHGFDML